MLQMRTILAQNQFLQYNSGLQKMLRPFPPLIDKKSCYSTGRVKFFIETFRALGVARGH